MNTDDKQKEYVVGIGEVLLDCFPNNKKRLGGAPAIFAYHAAQSGFEGLIISAVGCNNGKVDDDGKKILSELKRHNLKYRCKEIEGLKSGLVYVNDSDSNNPKYKIQKHDAWSAIPNYDDLYEIATHTRALYLGPLASYCGGPKYISKKTIDRFLKAVPKNCYKIFDVNLRSNPDENLYTDILVKEYIAKCNVLKVNMEELDYVCEIENISAVNERKRCMELLKTHPKLKYLIVTMGADGSSIYWWDKKIKDISYSTLVMPCKVKNTVGAGDALAGAFIGEILKGKSEISAHHHAVQRATVVCKAGNSMPNISRKDIFISYSRENSKIVNDVFCTCFEAQGWTVWIDKEDIDYGEHFPLKIEQAIRNSNVVVYFSSKDANKSKHVTREIKFAYANQKPIIPIKLDDEPFNADVDSFFKNINYMEYALSKLISSINKCINL